MKQILKNNNYLIKYIFSILGFFMFIFFIYINYIRERMPRAIPFDLSEYSFLLLLFICCLYFNHIKNIIKPKPINILLYKIRSKFMLPFIYLDFSIKYNEKIFPFYLQLLYYLIAKLYNKNYGDYILYIYIFQIIPRIILLLIFIVDVFKLHNISIFYYFIFLSIFPLFYNYIKYSLEFDLESLTKHIEKIYGHIYIYQRFPKEYYESLKEENNNIIDSDIAIYHDKLISVREYIQLQYDNKTNINENWYYEASPIAKEIIYDEYRKKNNKINGKLTPEDDFLIEHDFNEIMPLIIDLNICLKVEQKLDRHAYIPFIKIIIYILYFISWLYILFISLHTLHSLPLTTMLLYELLHIHLIIKKYFILKAIKLSIIILIMKYIKHQTYNDDHTDKYD